MTGDPTAEELAQFLDYEEKRKTAQKQADIYERQAEPLKKKFKAYVEAKGGADRTTTRCGYILRLISRAGTPKWKDEFLKALGDKGAQAALDLQAKAPPTLMLVVEPTAG